MATFFSVCSSPACITLPRFLTFIRGSPRTCIDTQAVAGRQAQKTLNQQLHLLVKCQLCSVHGLRWLLLI